MAVEQRSGPERGGPLRRSKEQSAGLAAGGPSQAEPAAPRRTATGTRRPGRVATDLNLQHLSIQLHLSPSAGVNDAGPRVLLRRGDRGPGSGSPGPRPLPLAA